MAEWMDGKGWIGQVMDGWTNGWRHKHMDGEIIEWLREERM